MSGNAVRLGIAAPEELRILREEVEDHSADQAKAADAASNQTQVPDKLRHAIRNRLNAAMLGLHLLHRELETGTSKDAEAVVMQVLRELESLDNEIAGLGRIESTSSEVIVAPRRVLLVDDSRNESQLLAGYLRAFDYEVDTASDGIEAMAYLEAHQKPDVVLMDMQMPRLDGATTIRRIRETPSPDGVRLFAVSGPSSCEAGIEIGPHGADR